MQVSILQYPLSAREGFALRAALLLLVFICGVYYFELGFPIDQDFVSSSTLQQNSLVFSFANEGISLYSTHDKHRDSYLDTWDCPREFRNSTAATWLCAEGHYLHDVVKNIGSSIIRFIGLRNTKEFESGMDLGCAKEFSGDIFFDKSRESFWRLEKVAQSGLIAGPNHKQVVIHPTKSSTGKKGECKVCPPNCTAVSYREESCRRICLASEDSAAAFKACWQCAHWRHEIYLSTDKDLPGEEDPVMHALWPMRVLFLVEAITQTLVDNPSELEFLFEEKSRKHDHLDVGVQSKKYLHHVIHQISKSNLGEQQSFSAGGGGGAGFQIECAGVVRVSLGGGGGAGLSNDPGEQGLNASSQAQGTSGTGFGAGVQLFDQSGKEILSTGGGGGGGADLSRARSETNLRSTSWHLRGAEFGSIADGNAFVNTSTFSWYHQNHSPMNSHLGDAVHDLVTLLRHDVRECLKEGKLAVKGGGGAGSGASYFVGNEEHMPAFGGATLEMRLITNPCPFGCAQQQMMAAAPDFLFGDSTTAPNSGKVGLNVHPKMEESGPKVSSNGASSHLPQEDKSASESPTLGTHVHTEENTTFFHEHSVSNQSLQAPPDNVDQCKYGLMTNTFKYCKVQEEECVARRVLAKQQGDFNYGRCMCPCLKERFINLSCNWAHRIQCLE